MKYLTYKCPTHGKITISLPDGEKAKKKLSCQMPIDCRHCNSTGMWGNYLCRYCQGILCQQTAYLVGVGWLDQTGSYRRWFISPMLEGVAYIDAFPCADVPEGSRIEPDPDFYMVGRFVMEAVGPTLIGRLAGLDPGTVTNVLLRSHPTRKVRDRLPRMRTYRVIEATLNQLIDMEHEKLVAAAI